MYIVISRVDHQDMLLNRVVNFYSCDDKTLNFYIYHWSKEWDQFRSVPTLSLICYKIFLLSSGEISCLSFCLDICIPSRHDSLFNNLNILNKHRTFNLET